MTDEFLKFTKEKGNDLSTPSVTFRGLVAGQKWCICADRYSQAAREGKAPPVVLDATHENARQWQLVQGLLKGR